MFKFLYRCSFLIVFTCFFATATQANEPTNKDKKATTANSADKKSLQKAAPKAKKTEKKNQAKSPYNPVDLKKKRSEHWDRPYLLAAYAAIWVLMFFYLVLMTQRFRKTQKDIDQLRSQLSALEAKSDTPPNHDA